MEPLREDELDVLLRWGEPQWRPSPELDGRVLGSHKLRPWEWLWRGSVRVPVPVALALLAVLGLLAWNRMPQAKQVDQFQPVKQLEIKLVRSGDAN